MSSLDYDLGLDVYALECPWCGENNVVDYEDFGEASNGSESDTEFAKCEKPLHTVIDFQFTIYKGEEK